MRVDFIRHGLTAGNLEQRYIGSTDEPLCSQGREGLMNMAYPSCDMVFTSPMKRCIETARLIHPEKEPVICGSLRECDFGDFEGRNYEELSADSRYQSWIDSGGEAAFPNGESPAAFRERCVKGFLDCIARVPRGERAAFVVHGGTIMAVMERFAVPRRSYFDWHIRNGHGYITEFDGETITVTENI